MSEQLRLFGWLPAEAVRPHGLDSRCLDCGVDTVETGDYYMLRDPVWLEANPDDVGMLCFACVERRLRRPLAPSDFALVPLNFHPWQSYSVRSRVFGWRRTTDLNGDAA